MKDSRGKTIRNGSENPSNSTYNAELVYESIWVKRIYLLLEIQ
jgi:hypothetical protein